MLNVALTHFRYGAYLSKEEVDDLLAPHPDTVTLVEEWLQYHGVHLPSISRSDSGHTLTFNATVSQAERMLGASYRIFYKPSSDTRLIRTLQYQVPSELKLHILVVSPTTYIGGPEPMSTNFLKASKATSASQYSGPPEPSSSPYPSDCYYSTSPSCLIQVTNIDYQPNTTSMSSLGILEFGGSYASEADLQVRAICP